eukprot:TRINITY_DN401_c0_g1_i5.p1 TRINITY_DN401_c0_g1~~TRINITY_DN401_c0_g1_i5.p1  ORF type:complete len:1363 (+),score=426.18 TRINITY_DN401_c0_g1_i5:74-4162(+)
MSQVRVGVGGSKSSLNIAGNPMTRARSATSGGPTIDTGAHDVSTLRKRWEHTANQTIDDQQRKLCEERNLGPLLKLEKWPHVKIQSQAREIIENLDVLPETRDLFIDGAMGFRPLVELSKFPEEDVEAICISALAALAQHPLCRARMMQEVGWHNIRQKWLESPSLASKIATMSLLASLSYEKDNQEAIILKGVPMLLDLLEGSPPRDLYSETLKALATITLIKEFGAKEIWTTRLLPLILPIVLNDSHPSLQLHAINILANICSSASEQVLEQVVSSKVLEVLVPLLSHDKPEVLKHTILAAVYLTRSPIGRKEFRSLGGVRSVIPLIDQRNGELQLSTATSVDILADYPDTNAELVSNRAIEPLKELIFSTPFIEVEDTARSALGKLSMQELELVDRRLMLADKKRIAINAFETKEEREAREKDDRRRREEWDKYKSDELSREREEIKRKGLEEASRRAMEDAKRRADEDRRRKEEEVRRQKEFEETQRRAAEIDAEKRRVEEERVRLQQEKERHELERQERQRKEREEEERLRVQSEARARELAEAQRRMEEERRTMEAEKAKLERERVAREAEEVRLKAEAEKQRQVEEAERARIDAERSLIEQDRLDMERTKRLLEVEEENKQRERLAREKDEERRRLALEEEKAQVAADKARLEADRRVAEEARRHQDAERRAREEEERKRLQHEKEEQARMLEEARRKMEEEKNQLMLERVKFDRQRRDTEIKAEEARAAAAVAAEVERQRLEDERRKQEEEEHRRRDEKERRKREDEEQRLQRRDSQRMRYREESERRPSRADREDFVHPRRDESLRDRGRADDARRKREEEGRRRDEDRRREDGRLRRDEPERSDMPYKRRSDDDSRDRVVHDRDERERLRREDEERRRLMLERDELSKRVSDLEGRNRDIESELDSERRQREDEATRRKREEAEREEFARRRRDDFDDDDSASTSSDDAGPESYDSDDSVRPRRSEDGRDSVPADNFDDLNKADPGKPTRELATMLDSGRGPRPTSEQMRTLRSFGRDRDMSSMLQYDGRELIPVLIWILQNYPTRPENEKIITSSLLILSILAYNREANQTTIRRCGGAVEFRKLIDVNIPPIKARSTLAMAAYVLNNDYNKRDMAQDMTPRLIGVLKQAAALDESLKMSSCACLAALVDDSNENQNRVRGIGGIKLIMGLVSANQIPPKYSINVIAALSHHNKEIQNDMRKEYPGIFRKIVRLLSVHTKPQIRKAAAHALVELARKNKKNQREVHRAGAVPYLLALLGSFYPPAPSPGDRPASVASLSPVFLVLSEDEVANCLYLIWAISKHLKNGLHNKEFTNPHGTLKDIVTPMTHSENAEIRRFANAMLDMLNGPLR